MGSNPILTTNMPECGNWKSRIVLETIEFEGSTPFSGTESKIDRVLSPPAKRVVH